MITKQEILEDFWDRFPQYIEITPTYESIRFEEEEIREWNKDWIEFIWGETMDYINFNVETLKDLEEVIKIPE